MKILIYAHSFPPSKGGLQYSNLEIVKGLHQLGHNIRLITCYNKGIRQFISNFSFPVRILPKWNFATMNSVSRNGLPNWIFAPWYFFIILKEIRRFKPDVGFITDETANAFWGVISRSVKIPYISYCSVPVFNQKKLYSKHKLIKIIFDVTISKIINQLLKSYKRSKRIIVVSRSTSEQLNRVIPEARNKISIIPRSIDDIYFRMQYNKNQINRRKAKLGISENHVVFLSVSRLTKDKGIDDVLKALDALENNKKIIIKYIVLGSGGYRTSLEKMVTDCNLKNNVIFHDEVDHSELIYYYDMCDIFILPSRRGTSESFGRVFAEAAARFKAAIAVNEGGMKDIIENGKTGFLIPSGNIQILKKTIEYILQNKERIVKMGIDARKKAEKKYTNYENSKKFQICLEKISS